MTATTFPGAEISTRSARVSGAGRAGLRDAGPIALGLAPFAVVVGTASIGQHVSGLGGLAATFLLYSGTAQTAALGLLGSGAAPVAVLATVAIVSVRLLLYGAALEPSFRHQPLWFRWLGPHLIIDGTFAAATARGISTGRDFRRYWLGLGTTVGACWTGGVGAGMLLRSALPPQLPLDAATLAVLVGLLVPQLVTRASYAAATAAAIVAALGSALPAGSGIAAGALAGLLAGTAANRRNR